MIELRTLGTVDLAAPSGDADTASVRSRPKALALLVRLALGSRGGPVRRDTLLALFWPELPEERARRALSQTLYILRGALGGAVVATVGKDDLRVDRELLACDACRLLDALDEGRRADAVELYDGNFLPGFHVAGCPKFDRWLHERRSAMRRAAVRAALDLAREAAEEGRALDTARWVRWALVHVPHDEGLLQRGMQLLDGVGNRSGALQLYEAFAERLRKELELEPSPETEELVDELRKRERTNGAGSGTVEGAPPRASGSPTPQSPTPTEEKESLPAAQRSGGPRADRGAVDLMRSPAAVVVVVPILGVLAYAAFVHFDVGGPADHAVPEIRSLAVLPLEDRSPALESEQYFADGMTEALTVELGQIGALTVKSHASAMRYQGTDRTTLEIARELGVEGLIVGSVLRLGQQVRITVQLVHGPTDRQLWSESYQRDVEDVLTLQAEVARAVAQELEITLTASEEARLAANRLVQPEAYVLWLRGNFHLQSLTEESFRRALRLFEEAIAIDPDYAPAHAGIANAYLHLGSWFVSEPSPDVLSRAKEAVERALELDPTLAEAHWVHGMILFWFEWKWTEADTALQRAIELNPNLAPAYVSRSHLLAVLGRTGAAIRMGRRGLELDPLSPSAHFQLAYALDLADRAEEAMELYTAGLQAYPRSHQGHNLIADFHYARNREFDKALPHLTQVLEIAEFPRALGVLGYVYGKTDRETEARATIGRLLEFSSIRHTATAVAFVHLGLNEHDEALRWLERAYEERDQSLVWLKEHWAFDPLRSDPRFEDLLRRMDYPDG